MKICRALLFLVFFGAFSTHALATDRFSAGTMTLGGVAFLPFKYDEFKNISLDLNLRPSFGYFVYKNLELSAKILLSSNLYYSSSQKHFQPDLFKWGVSLNAAYYFDFVSPHFVPYAGLGAGYEMVQLQWRTEVVSLEALAGFFVPITQNLALDFGMPVKINFSGFYANNIRSIEMPIGFLGIRGFL